uniref:YncE family protein n=1 Tax=Photorhabdus sp. RM322S TaxID=3342825 RepID=UPI0036D7ED80
MIGPTITYIKIFDEPADITVNDETGAVYVSNIYGDMARIDYVSPGNFTYGGTAKKALQIAGFEANSVNGNVYVSDEGLSSTLPPIDVYDENLNFLSRLTGIPDIVGNWSANSYFYKNNNELYFPWKNTDAHTGGLVVVNAATGMYKKNIDTSVRGVNDTIYSITCARDLGFLFLANYNGWEVTPINTRLDEETPNIDLGHDNQPMGLAVDDKRHFLLVGVRKNLGYDGFSIDKYTALSHRPRGSIDLGSEDSTTIAVDNSNDVVYAVSNSGVKCYSLNDDSLVGEIKISNGQRIDLVPVIYFDERRNILYLLDGKAKGEDSHLIVLDNSVVQK